jgi:hypothetical protein
MGILMEISQKIQGVAEGYDPIQLFDRNTSWCTSYNHPCEYMGICRSWNLGGCPHGFRQTTWLERDSVVKLSQAVKERYNGAPDDEGQLQLDLASSGIGKENT